MIIEIKLIETIQKAECIIKVFFDTLIGKPTYTVVPRKGNDIQFHKVKEFYSREAADHYIKQF